jgi:hypothetical protein
MHEATNILSKHIQTLLKNNEHVDYKAHNDNISAGSKNVNFSIEEDQDEGENDKEEQIERGEMQPSKIIELDHIIKDKLHNKHIKDLSENMDKGILLTDPVHNNETQPICNNKPINNILIPRGNTVTSDLFLGWVKQANIKMVNLNIHISSTNNENKIKSPDDIKEDDSVIFIPKDYIITSYTALKSTRCKDLDSIIEFKDYVEKICLTLYILLDLPTHFETYINFLISTIKFENIPFFYNQTERLYLKGTYFEQLILAKEKQLYKEYDVLVTRGYLGVNISRDVYVTYRTVVMSKTFQVNQARDKLTIFAPLVDLIPHNSRKANTRLEFDEKENLVLKNPFEIKANSYIFTVYNRWSNYYNLLSYGFADKEGAGPIEIFLALNVGGKTIEQITLGPSLKINALIKNIRRIIQQQTTKIEDSKNSGFQISVESELESLRLLKTAIGEQMRLTNKANENLPSDGFNYKSMKVVLTEEEKVKFL